MKNIKIQQLSAKQLQSIRDRFANINSKRSVAVVAKLDKLLSAKTTPAVSVK